MHKHLQFTRRLGTNHANLVQRKLTRQDYPADAKLLRQLDPFGAGDAHLGAAMHFHLRRNLPGQLRDSHILYDDRISPSGGNFAQGLGRSGQFVIKDQRVKGNVAFYPAPVQSAHHLG